MLQSFTLGDHTHLALWSRWLHAPVTPNESGTPQWNPEIRCSSCSSCTSWGQNPQVQTVALPLLRRLISTQQVCEVFVLNFGWTLLNYDKHCTENNICFHGRIEILCDMKKIATLVLPCWWYRTSWSLTYLGWHLFFGVFLNVRMLVSQSPMGNGQIYQFSCYGE